MKTLNDFIKTYNPKRINISIGKHLVVVDFNIEGSDFIVEKFNNELFSFDFIIADVLYLTLKDDL